MTEGMERAGAGPKGTYMTLAVVCWLMMKIHSSMQLGENLQLSVYYFSDDDDTLHVRLVVVHC